jgi:hypothetical protein
MDVVLQIQLMYPQTAPNTMLLFTLDIICPALLHPKAFVLGSHELLSNITVSVVRAIRDSQVVSRLTTSR